MRTSNSENFTKSYGKTGDYIQYAVVGINSILEKAGQSNDKKEIKISHILEREATQHSYANVSLQSCAITSIVHCKIQ